MTGTVKARIVAELAARLGALASVGSVADACAEEETDLAATVAPASGAGKVAVEYIVDDDTPNERHAALGLDAWDFDVHVLGHLPRLAGRTPADIAADFHGDVYSLYGPEAQRQLPETGTGTPLAVDVQPLGGGGCALQPDPQGFSSFRVTYRHRMGDPTALG